MYILLPYCDQFYISFISEEKNNNREIPYDHDNSVLACGEKYSKNKNMTLMLVDRNVGMAMDGFWEVMEISFFTTQAFMAINHHTYFSLEKFDFLIIPNTSLFSYSSWKSKFLSLKTP